MLPFDRSVLEFLADLHPGSGMSVKWISSHIKNTYCKDFPRGRSGAILAALKLMERDGLVRRMDGGKPIGWQATDAGRIAARRKELT